MQELRINEIGNKYDNWLVVDYAGAKRGKATWNVKCSICEHLAIILGRDLRKGIKPKHKCRKICRECSRSELTVVFAADNFGNICVDCRKQYMTNWRKDNQQHVADYLLDWNNEHQDNIKRYRKQHRKHIEQSYMTYIKDSWGNKLRNIRHYATMPNNGRASRLHRRPESYKVGVNLEYLFKMWNEQNGKCALSNMIMTHEFHNPRSVSIDRIDSDVGYVDGNIQLVCQWVNLAKSSHSNMLMKQILHEFKSQE